MTFRSRAYRAATAAIVLTFFVWADGVALTASGQPGDSSPAKTSTGGTSLAEKIACAYLLVGGTIMLYYGPKERENGQWTMDGKSETVAGAVSIGISIALLHDILKKRTHAPRP